MNTIKLKVLLIFSLFYPSMVVSVWLFLFFTNCDPWLAISEHVEAIHIIAMFPILLTLMTCFFAYVKFIEHSYSELLKNILDYIDSLSEQLLLASIVVAIMLYVSIGSLFHRFALFPADYLLAAYLLILPPLWSIGICRFYKNRFLCVMFFIALAYIPLGIVMPMLLWENNKISLILWISFLIRISIDILSTIP